MYKYTLCAKTLNEMYIDRDYYKVPRNMNLIQKRLCITYNPIYI